MLSNTEKIVNVLHIHDLSKKHTHKFISQLKKIPSKKLKFSCI